MSADFVDKNKADRARLTQSEENWWDFCPLCNTKLVNQKCKYVCPSPQCNFFMSCSEFDL